MSYIDIERLTWMRERVAKGEVRSIREQANLSIQDMARAIGVDQTTLGRWERGNRTPRGPKALVYAQMLHRLAVRLESRAIQ